MVEVLCTEEDSRRRTSQWTKIISERKAELWGGGKDVPSHNPQTMMSGQLSKVPCTGDDLFFSFFLPPFAIEVTDTEGRLQ